MKSSKRGDGGFSQRTESRIQHVERHLVALLRSRDRDQPFITIVLWFINLDNTSGELAYFVDLCASLADDRADHVVRNKDLLSEGLAGKHSHRVRSCSSLGGGSTVSLAGLVRSSARVAGSVLGVGVVDGGLGSRRRRLSVEVGDTVGVGRRTLRRVRVALVGLRVAVVSVERLRLVRNDLHSPGNRSSWSAGSSSVRRCGRSSIPLGELFHKGVRDVVGGDVNGIGDTGHN